MDWTAAIAAAKASRAGLSVDEQEIAARKSIGLPVEQQASCKENASLTPEVQKGVEIDLDLDTAEAREKDIADFRRYLKAVCNLGRGQFDELNTLDLVDCAAVVKVAVQNREMWRATLGE